MSLCQKKNILANVRIIIFFSKVAKFVSSGGATLHTNSSHSVISQDVHHTIDLLNGHRGMTSTGSADGIEGEDDSAHQHSEGSGWGSHSSTSWEDWRQQHEENEVVANNNNHDEIYVSGHRTFRQSVKQTTSYSSREEMVSSKQEQHYRNIPARPRRDAETDFLADVNCGSSRRCTLISCRVGPLEKRQFTLFKVRSRLWVRSLEQVPRNDIEISSKLVTRVTQLPYGVNPSYLGHRVHLVTTQVRNIYLSESAMALKEVCSTPNLPMALHVRSHMSQVNTIKI